MQTESQRVANMPLRQKVVDNVESAETAISRVVANLEDFIATEVITRGEAAKVIARLHRHLENVEASMDTNVELAKTLLGK